MLHTTRIRAGVSAPKWHAVLSLVLAVLFFYNPYQSLPNSSGGLNLRHRASYRATVGSSELQHFTATDRQDEAAVQDHAIVELFASLSSLANRFAPRPDEELLFQPQVLCASLWFRPPPAR
jgi:hypothetical protein